MGTILHYFLGGTVTDDSGAAVVKANVTLARPERGITRSSTTSQTGEYEFSQLSPGTYQLSVEMKGFRNYVQKDIQLLVSTPAAANVTLQVGAFSEVVARSQGLNINLIASRQ